MNIDQPSLNFIKRVIKCATIGNIDNVAIESGKIRGMDDDQIVFIYQDTNVPSFPFGSIGFNRLPTFTARLDMLDGLKNAIITASVDTGKDGTSFVRSLNMSAGNIKVDYRCANPAVIRAPKKLVDSIQYEITITPTVISYMTRARTAMSSDEISIISDGANTKLEMSDVNRDVFTYTFDTPTIDIVTAEPPIFTHIYPIKTILPLLKAASSEVCYITGTNGMLVIEVEGLQVYVFPRSSV